MPGRILLVDDEKPILSSLARLFMDTDYEILTADSGKAGLAVLAETPVDVVISDMRMPEMDGSQFLRQVKNLYPLTTRLILSGYAEERTVLDSLVDGVISMYIFKPWDSKSLKKKIDQIFMLRSLWHNPAMLAIVNRMDNLSTIIGTYREVCRLIDEDAEISRIAKVIEADPTVTAAILRIVNSACFNIETYSVAQAVTFLGLPTVKALVLSCSLLTTADIKVPPFSVKMLTNHISATNRYMTAICNTLLNKNLPERLSTAGLFGNLGLFMLLHYFPEEVRKIIQLYSTVRGSALPDLEREAFGLTHTELGAYLLDYWGIPYSLVECVLFYRAPLHEAVMDKEAVCIMHLADHLAWKEVAPALAGELDERVYDVLNIPADATKSILKKS